jgi:hypothetical protein
MCLQNGVHKSSLKRLVLDEPEFTHTNRDLIPNLGFHAPPYFRPINIWAVLDICFLAI